MSEKSEHRFLGKPRKIIDGGEKVRGQARYTGDVVLPGMLHLRPVLSEHAHAELVAIDSSEAEKVPGVVRVLTAEDLPSRDQVITSRNSAVLAKERVLFVGQPVAVVAAESEAAAQDAAARVRVSYRPLPVVGDLDAALAPDAPIVWPQGLPRDDVDLSAHHADVDAAEDEVDDAVSNVHAEKRYERGDVALGFAEADVILENSFRTPTLYQGYLEPLSAVAEPDPRGGVTIYTSTQGQFLVRNEVSRIVGLPQRRVRIVPMTVGGGFGAKYGIVEPLAAAAALALGRPVRLVLTRSEDFVTTTPAPEIRIDLKVGAKRDGTLTALEAQIYLDNGAFAFTVGGITALLLGSYYRLPHLRIDTFEVITNRPQAGAYRAPGAPAATFAIESTIDELARRLELDPLELRLRNAAESGDLMSTGKPWPSIGLRTCLEAMRQHPAWLGRTRAGGDADGERIGYGLAIGGWPGAASPAAAVCRVENDGTVRLHLGSVDISGSSSSLVLVAADILGVPPEQIELVQGDTDSGPFAPSSGGSQVTYSVAGAVARAVEEVKGRLLELAAEHLEARREDLELSDGHVQVSGVPSKRVPIGQLAAVAERRRGGPGPIIGDGRAAPTGNAPGFVAHLAKVKVDADTGAVAVLDYWALQDVGFALNPLLVEGQVHGGVAQGLGWALHEVLRYSAQGQPLSGSFSEYDLPKAAALPRISATLLEHPSPDGPFGARGVGEPPVTAVPAAIANAVRDAVGVRLTTLPLTAERVWQALRQEREVVASESS